MTNQGPPERPVGLGEGAPPAEMTSRYGMEAADPEGPSDEIEGEILGPDEAERLSEQPVGGAD